MNLSISKSFSQMLFDIGLFLRIQRYFKNLPKIVIHIHVCYVPIQKLSMHGVVMPHIIIIMFPEPVKNGGFQAKASKTGFLWPSRPSTVVGVKLRVHFKFFFIKMSDLDTFLNKRVSIV